MMTVGSFRSKLTEVLREWETCGLPPRWTLLSELKRLKEIREIEGIALFDKPPLILTATLDDGWGIGIETIHAACEALGISYVFVGLLVSPDLIVQKCEELKPDIVGVTVLHESSLELVKKLDESLPEKILIFVGGMPIAREGFSERLKSIRNVLEFLKFFWSPGGCERPGG